MVSHLVHRKNQGFAASKQHIGHILVGGGDAGAQVGDQNNHIGAVDGSSACRRIWERITSSARGSMPPVSTNITSLFLHSQGA